MGQALVAIPPTNESQVGLKKPVDNMDGGITSTRELIIL